MKPLPDYQKRKGYRLPSEAEWEYAARAGTASTRYYGSSAELLPRYGWFTDNSKNAVADNRAWPAGQKRPNDLGLADMHGNAWTLVDGPGYSLPKQQGTTAVIDREIPEPVTEVVRLMRGGSFDSNPLTLRSPTRGYTSPSSHGLFNGFRVARTCP